MDGVECLHVMCVYVLLQVRFQAVIIVQALCVLVAASNAARVCAVCCSTFMSPSFCLLKAWATQVPTPSPHLISTLYPLHIVLQMSLSGRTPLSMASLS